MPAAEICIDCSRATTEAVGGRCPDCAPGHERRRAATRQLTEPWRRAYSLRAWARGRARAFKRDGHRCRVAEHGKRCTETTDLHGHHHPESLEELFERAPSWRVFVEWATDPDRIVTTCAAHNNALDAERRRARA